MAIHSRIESLGVYLPPTQISSEEVLEGCQTKLNLDLAGLTGIKSRPVVQENEFSLDLAIKAASKCLEISRYRPQEIEMVISSSICRINGPNWEESHEPSNAIGLARHFNLRPAVAFDVSNACAGMFTALLVMDAYIKAGWIKRGLIVSGEYITHLTRAAQRTMKNPVDPQFASLTLGDSGAALILDGTDDPDLGFHDLEIFTAAQYCDLCIGIHPQDGHGGYVMNTNSSKMFKVGMPLTVEQIASKVKNPRWENNERLYMIFHQVASRAIQTAAKLINGQTHSEICARDRLVDNVEQRGNTSSTSHFVALWDWIQKESIHSGDSILFGIQASGFTVGVATYTLDDLPQRILAGQRNRQPALAA